MKGRIEGKVVIEFDIDEARKIAKLIGETSVTNRMAAKLAYSISDDPLSKLYAVLDDTIKSLTDKG